MAKLRAIPGGKGKEKTFSLVYGMRLYSGDSVQQVAAGEVQAHDGEKSRVTMHLIEGTREQIRAQLLASIDAFFEIHADSQVPARVSPGPLIEEVGDPGC